MAPRVVKGREVLSFLKWAGGKTRYASTLNLLIPEYAGVYREPFCGSAALFFFHGPERAVLSDENVELVVALQQVAADPHAVMAELDRMPRTEDHFRLVRARRPAELSDIQRAARVVYLNKQAFRGLWRVNRRNEFNVPWGGYGTTRELYNTETMLRASKALSAAVVCHQDFEVALDAAGEGDFVYCDPPYVPLGGWADFKRYTAGQFGVDDHRRLEAAMRRAADRGALVMATNSDTPLVREIWGSWRLWRMPTVRDISINSRARASADLVITSFVPPLLQEALLES